MPGTLGQIMEHHGERSRGLDFELLTRAASRCSCHLVAKMSNHSHIVVSRIMFRRNRRSTVCISSIFQGSDVKYYSVSLGLEEVLIHVANILLPKPKRSASSFND